VRRGGALSQHEGPPWTRPPMTPTTESVVASHLRDRDLPALERELETNPSGVIGPALRSILHELMDARSSGPAAAASGL
jgi:hypothetical protein